VTAESNRRPLRVAMIGQKGYPPVQGGIEKHVAELAARLPLLGIEVDIYSRPHYSDLAGPCDLPGVRVLRLPSLPTKHLDAISHTLVATCDALVRRPDLIHYHALGPGMLAGIPRRLAGIPTVATVHGLDWQREKWGRFARRFLQYGERAAVTLPNATIVVSRALADYYRREHDSRVEYVPNGITSLKPLAPRLSLAQGIPERYILFVGRLVPEKGCHLLLEAWRTLPQEVKMNRELIIAGDAGFTSGYVDELKQQAGGRVRFTGFIHGDFLTELYSNAEVVVLPSTLEGLSIALLEGMSFQRACLVSDIPPNREAAGEAAHFFSSGNAGDLAIKLTELLADGELRRRLGESAGKRVRGEYAWDRVTDQTAAIYRRIVGQGPV